MYDRPYRQLQTHHLFFRGQTNVLTVPEAHAHTIMILPQILEVSGSSWGKALWTQQRMAVPLWCLLASPSSWAGLIAEMLSQLRRAPDHNWIIARVVTCMFISPSLTAGVWRSLKWARRSVMIYNQHRWCHTMIAQGKKEIRVHGDLVAVNLLYDLSFCSHCFLLPQGSPFTKYNRPCCVLHRTRCLGQCDHNKRKHNRIMNYCKDSPLWLRGICCMLPRDALHLTAGHAEWLIGEPVTLLHCTKVLPSPSMIRKQLKCNVLVQAYVRYVQRLSYHCRSTQTSQPFKKSICNPMLISSKEGIRERIQ